MNPLDFFILALAVRGLVDVWNNGSIFAGARATVEVWGVPGDDTLFGRIKMFASDLLSCAYCTTYQAALWLAVLHCLYASVPPPGAAAPAVYCLWAAGWLLLQLARALTCGLAVAAAAWLMELHLRSWRPPAGHGRDKPGPEET